MRVLMILMLTLLTVAQTQAGPKQSREEIAEKCKGDVQKFCKDIKPGQGKLYRCLHEHEAKLSAGCKAWYADSHQKLKNWSQNVATACSGDLDTHCKDVKPGGGRLVKCLHDHEEDLSGSCKANFKKPTQ